jgi:sensor c-di-GMP phosphodiesterase-like protein
LATEVNLAAVQAAFAAGELFLAYQPIVALRDGTCAGAEALIRWRRNGAVLDAAEFMPLTDRTPLSGVLTYWVIDTVASDLGGWLSRHPSAHIGINIPPEILGRGGIEYAAVKSGLREHAKQLIFEITERGIPDDLGLQALNRIPETGARAALDDVTLSGANLALLTRCPFDLIKVDQTLVAQLGVDQPTPAWLDGLATLLRSTPLEVIAEGVETEHQAEVLRGAGVQLAQGHWFAEALTAELFKGYYAHSSPLL